MTEVDAQLRHGLISVVWRRPPAPALLGAAVVMTAIVAVVATRPYAPIDVLVGSPSRTVSPVGTGSDPLVVTRGTQAVSSMVVVPTADELTRSGPRAWRELPPGPFPDLTPRVLVWSGRQLIVWRGENTRGALDARVDRSASFDLPTLTWSRLPPDPLGGPVHVVSTSGVGTGGAFVRGEALFWGRGGDGGLEPATLDVAVAGPTAQAPHLRRCVDRG